MKKLVGTLPMPTEKKWKPGQLVTLWGKVYRIHKCFHITKYSTCFFCNHENTAPCINANNYPVRKGFDVKTCCEKMPTGCYPKLVK